MSKGNKVLLFYNPFSGDGSFSYALDNIIEKFQEKGLQIIPVRVGDNKPLDRVMKSMDQDEYRQIIVSGGDGTINICVNAMMKYGIDLPLALFPNGTANDFASYFGVPTNIQGMIHVALGDYIQDCDIGQCNDSYFVNVAAVGDPVDVSQSTAKGLKNSLGLFSYYMQGITEIANMKPHAVRIVADGKTYHENVYFILVLNGKSVGGLKQASPDSEVDDGKFNVIVFREVSVLKFPAIFMNAIKGTLAESDDVLAFEASDILIEASDTIPTDVDGESGQKLPLHLKVLRHKIRIFVPERHWAKTNGGD